MPKLTELIKRCARGEAKAQEAFYDLLKGRLMGVCMRYTKEQEDANDVFQEAMIRVFRNIKRIHEVDNVLAWATRIASNVAIDHYKKKRANMMVSIDESEEAMELSSEELSAIEALETAELLQIMQLLPQNYLVVLNLYMIDGYSHKEIANQLDIAVSTSRVLLTRAKRKMIELLKKIDTCEQVYG